MTKKSGGAVPKWDRRWFELSDTGFLHYYKKEGGKNAGSVFLKGAPARIEMAHPDIIKIDTEGRTYHIQAQSAREAAAWLQDISFYTEQ